MHKVLFSVVCIKRGGGAKTLYSSIRKCMYIIYASRDNNVGTRQR